MTQSLNLAEYVNPQVIFSGQQADTTEDTLFTCPANSTAIIKHGTVCNTSSSSVNVSISVLRSGQATGTGQHHVISAYPLAAGDTLSLTDYLGECCLQPGDFITAQASVAAAVDIVLSGVVSS